MDCRHDRVVFNCWTIDFQGLTDRQTLLVFNVCVCVCVRVCVFGLVFWIRDSHCCHVSQEVCDIYLVAHCQMLRKDCTL